jgi:hypothetical protein
MLQAAADMYDVKVDISLAGGAPASVYDKELAEEIGGRKAEATLKMSKENNDLTGFEHRFDLVTWKPADDSFRNPPGPVEPVDLILGHVGTPPGSACLVLSGGPARCADLLFPAGRLTHPGGVVG